MADQAVTSFDELWRSAKGNPWVQTPDKANIRAIAEAVLPEEDLEGAFNFVFSMWRAAALVVTSRAVFLGQGYPDPTFKAVAHAAPAAFKFSSQVLMIPRDSIVGVEWSDAQLQIRTVAGAVVLPAQAVKQGELVLTALAQLDTVSTSPLDSITVEVQERANGTSAPTADSSPLSFLAATYQLFEAVVSNGLKQGEFPETEGATIDDVVACESRALALSFFGSDGQVSQAEVDALTSVVMDPGLSSADVDARRLAQELTSNVEIRDWKYSVSTTLAFFTYTDLRLGTKLVADYRASALLLAKSICALDERSVHEFSDLEHFARVLSYAQSIVNSNDLAKLDSITEFRVTGRIVADWRAKFGSPLNDEIVDANSNKLLEEFLRRTDGTSDSSGTRNHESVGPSTVSVLDARSQMRDEGDIEIILDELDRLIGLEEVKSDVRSLANRLHIDSLRRAQGLRVAATSRHLVLQGNPGTGKTEVARLLARIYKALGLLEQGHLVETDRSGLVAGYIGHTALKTAEVFASAKGGVLFIDEAYSLAKGGDQDFGQEAVDTLLKLMEDNRSEIVVIAAGYPDLMARFLDSNPGLRSRFSRTIPFSDYSTDELVDIYTKFATDSDYVCAAGTLNEVRGVFEKVRRDKSFANARTARLLFEATLDQQADRIAALANMTAEMNLLCPTDVPVHQA